LFYYQGNDNAAKLKYDKHVLSFITLNPTKIKCFDMLHYEPSLRHNTIEKRRR